MNRTTQIQKERLQTVNSPESICILSVCQEKNLGSQKFVDALENAVDLAFSSLGDSSSQIVKSYLRDNFGLTRHTIPQNLDLFVYALKDIFGQAASLIELKIMREIHLAVEEFRYYPSENELSFLAYLSSLRNSL